MSAPRVYAALIRHGAYRQLSGAPSAHQPFPLVAAGEAQARSAAQALGRELQQRRWRLHPVIDSSRLLRAWQTAEVIRRDCEGPGGGSRIEQFDALAERGVGSAANLTAAQIEAILAADPRFGPPPAGWKADSHYRLPLQGAESLLDAGRRVAGHLQQRMQALSAAATSDTLKLFVGHGAAFRHAAYHLGVLEYGRIAELSMHHARPIYLEYRADSPWLHTGGEWKIRASGAERRD